MTVQEFEILYNKLIEELIGYSINHYGLHLLTYDVVANSFLKLWKALQNKPDMSYGEISNYLYKCLRREWSDIIKSEQRRGKIDADYLRRADHITRNTKTTVESRSMLNRIRELVQQMPPIMRQIFVLLFDQNLTPREVADLLNISPDTVRVQKARALKFLKLRV